MENYKEMIMNANCGEIVPMVKPIDIDDPVDYFAKISNYGRAENCCMLESREYLANSGALSFGTANPALYISGKGRDFNIKALTDTGRAMLEYLGSKRE